MKLVLMSFLAGSILALCAGCNSGDDGGGGNVLTVKAVEYSYSLSGDLKGGVVTFAVENAGGTIHEFAFGSVEPGHSTDEIIAAVETGEDLPWLEDLGGVPVMSAGQKGKLTRELDPGKYVFLCFIPNAEGQPHAALGMIETFEITGEGDVEFPEADAIIEAQAGTFVVPEDLSAGQQTLELKNSASAEGGFLLVAFEEGETFDTVGAWFEAGLQGEAPAVFLGGMQIVQPGESVFYDVELESGRTYTLINDSSEDAPPIMTEFTPD